MIHIGVVLYVPNMVNYNKTVLKMHDKLKLISEPFNNEFKKEFKRDLPSQLNELVGNGLNKILPEGLNYSSEAYMFLDYSDYVDYVADMEDRSKRTVISQSYTVPFKSYFKAYFYGYHPYNTTENHDTLEKIWPKVCWGFDTMLGVYITLLHQVFDELIKEEENK